MCYDNIQGVITMPVPFIKIRSSHDDNPDKTNFYMHTHDTHEIFCFLGGEAKYCVEGTIYAMSPGDIFLMKKGEAHSLLLTSSRPYDRLYVNFNEDAILKRYSSKITEFIDKKPLGNYNRYPSLVFKNNNCIFYLNQILKNKDIDEQRLYLTVLLVELMNCPRNYIKVESTVEIIRSITEFINLHLKDDITIDMLCKKFHISKTHLSRKFKSTTGSTISKYILKKRLILANELMAKGISPTNIYTECGFRDYTTFYRAYKEIYNCSPKHYKDLHSI